MSEDYRNSQEYRDWQAKIRGDWCILQGCHNRKGEGEKFLCKFHAESGKLLIEQLWNSIER